MAIKTGPFKSAKNRMILWSVLLIAGLLWLKFAVPEPFPQLNTRISQHFTSEKYEDVILVSDIAKKDYPDRYYTSKIGYYKAFAQFQLAESERALATLLDYQEKTSRAQHVQTQRLLADLYLATGKTEMGLTIVLELFKEMPLRKLAILREVAETDPNFKIAEHLDPTKDELAYDVFMAFQKNSKLIGGYRGRVSVPQAGQIPMKESLFFTVGDIIKQVEGSKTIISGTIISAVNLKTMGYRLTGYGENDLYIDEKECVINDVKKGQANAFTCSLEDASTVLSAIIYELKYEEN